MTLFRVIDSFENLTRIVETFFLSIYTPIYNCVFNYGRGGCDWQLTTAGYEAVYVDAAFQREGKVFIRKWNQNQIKRGENKSL